MPWLTMITVVGVVVLAALVWLFIRTRSHDLIEEMLTKRRPASKAASRADFVEGSMHIPVAVSLADDRIFYENPDLDAYLDLKNLEEVEYDDETSTGHSVEGRVLRLRSHGHTFEFVLDTASSRQWEAVLPARQAGAGQKQAV